MKKTTLLILFVSIFVFTVNLYAVGNGDVDKKASAKSSKAKISDDRKTDSGNNGSTPQGYGYGSGYGDGVTDEVSDKPYPKGHPWEDMNYKSPYDEDTPDQSNTTQIDKERLEEKFNIFTYLKRLLLGN